MALQFATRVVRGGVSVVMVIVESRRDAALVCWLKQRL